MPNKVDVNSKEWQDYLAGRLKKITERIVTPPKADEAKEPGYDHMRVETYPKPVV